MIEKEDLFAALFQGSDDAIVAKTTDGIVQAWNPAAERLFGYSAAEMIGQSIRILLPGDRQQEEDHILDRIRAGEQVGQFFTRRIHKTGRLVDVSVTVSPVRNRAGQIVGASKIARDAGPHLADQRRLALSEQRFRMLADNIDQLAWIAAADGQIEWYNRQWYEFGGIDADANRPFRGRDLLHPDHYADVSEGFDRAIQRQEPWEGTFQLRAADGSYRWFLGRSHPIRDAAGRLVNWVGTNTDITDQREQAEQIRLLLMEVNHRSKNMLSTVQALARRTAVGQTDFIARFEDRVRSLAVNQDILVRRAWRDVPVAELVGSQLAFLQGAPGEVTIGGAPCAALIPRAAEVVGMALHELATNSLKYGALSIEGGQVAIGWRCPPDHDGFHIWWHESGGPPVAEPGRKGFGTTLIRDVPQHNLHAAVTLDYAPAGVRWSLAADSSVLAVQAAETAPSK
ncbi:PAS domain S-box protein [Croceibacterium ferulae]|uniref:PAS domain S-box protein n=1 Tax=Croceibacterium ferulae TaxID=1854641 RepID=UPI001F4EEE32|nr:PAS domain S-box protein [Croceibacterium ferulae]